jgi:predicted Zn-dependent protease
MPDQQNTRRRGWRQTTGLLLCGSLILAGAPHAEPLPELPDFGDVSGNLITPTAERRLGQAFMRSIRASEKVVDDPLVDDYLNELGRRLTRHTELGEDGFHFFLIDDPSVNAFAGPGGHIGIHTGLILTTESESELAAVLAHEIAHVTQKHLARSWQVASDMTVPQAAVLIAAAVLGATVSADAGVAAALGGQAAMLQRQIDFTRANEHEADRIGINLLAEADFDPHSMASFFTRMGRANRDQVIRLPEFLRTHPVTTSRIAEALDRADAHPYQQPTTDIRYQLLRERLRSQRQDALAPIADELERSLAEGRYRDRDAARYGLALALIREQRTTEGLALLEQLHKEQPAVVEYAVSAALTAAQLRDYGRALSLVADTPELAAHRIPLMLTRSQLLLASGQAEQALPVINELLERRPEDPRGHALAAQALQQTGQRMASHEQLATYHYLRGNTQAAVAQLEIALRVPGVAFYDASRLESRLNEYRKELVAIKNSH